MMGVYVKGMEMPQSCKGCNPAKNYSEWIRGGYDCRCGITNTKVKDQPKGTRPDWCPLMEVKTPHGRLIQEPAGFEYGGLAYISPLDARSTAQYFLKQIIEQPTVIEAEE